MLLRRLVIHNGGRWRGACAMENWARRLIERQFGRSGAMRLGFSIVSRWAAYVSNPPGVKKTAAICLFDPHNGLASCADTGLRKVSESTGNCALLVPFAVTLRHFRDARINQRIDSLPCPALSSMFPGRLARFARARTPEFHWRGFHQTTTIGLRRLELRLDYAGGGGEGRWEQVGSD